MPDESKTPTYDALSPKDRRLVDVYLSNGMVQWKAYFEVIWSGDKVAPNYDSIRANASIKFSDHNITTAIEERLKIEAMSTDEALFRLGEHARAAYSPYLDADGTVDVQGMIEDGMAHLIMGFKRKGKDGDVVEVVLPDVQAALEKILRAHGAYKDRTEISGPGGGPIEYTGVNFNRGSRRDSSDDPD